MNELLNSLFGLSGEGLGFGDEGVSFGFARGLPGWAWVLIAAGAALACGWSYRRLAGSRAARTALATLRWTIVLLLLVLAAGPRLIRPNDRIEQDWVVVLVDRSASLGIADLPGSVSRDEQLAGALEGAGAVLGEMAGQRRVLWLGFDGESYELGKGGVPDIGPADGTRTRLGAAIDDALRRTAARRLAGIVVLSDGASSDELSRGSLAQITASGAGVVAVPLGLEDPPGDLAIGEVLTPREAFTGDEVPVRVRVDRLGSASVPAGRVQLIDERTSLVLAERAIDPDAGSQEVVLTVRPDAPESARWRVRLVLDEPDLIPGNDAQSLTLDLIDRPLRVVYFDGSPRWEYRYLKNLLLREGSFNSSSLILAAGRRFIQEGEQPLARIPASLEDWAEFDVIVLGDVRAELFGTDQLESLRRHIAERGAGLLWIAGPRATPHGWRQTPLEDLLPFRLEARGGAMARWTEPVTTLPGNAAQSLGVLGGSLAAWPESVSDPTSGWSRLRYAQRIEPGQLKPAAEVVAWAQPASAPAEVDRATPLALTMRYGAGQIGYVATDETWRWRYGQGEALQERFWIPFVRALGRQSVGRLDRAATLAVVPGRGVVGQGMQVELRVFDPSLVSAVAGATRAVVRDQRDRTVRGEIPLTGEGAAGDATVARLSGGWTPSEPGRYLVEIDDPALAGLGLDAEVEVLSPDDEQQRPEADHATLARLAQAAGERGVLTPADQLARALTDLPRLDRVIEGQPESRTLWDRPIVLILLVLLFGLEWIGRRLISLS